MPALAPVTSATPGAARTGVPSPSGGRAAKDGGTFPSPSGVVGGGGGGGGGGGRGGGEGWSTFAFGYGMSAFGRPGGAHADAPTSASTRSGLPLPFSIF